MGLFSFDKVAVVSHGWFWGLQTIFRHTRFQSVPWRCWRHWIVLGKLRIGSCKKKNLQLLRCSKHCGQTTSKFKTFTRWWFQIFFFTPIWRRFPVWLIFFRRVETTNQKTFSFCFPLSTDLHLAVDLAYMNSTKKKSSGGHCRGGSQWFGGQLNSGAVGCLGSKRG